MQDFLNTQDVDAQTEALSSPEGPSISKIAGCQTVLMLMALTAALAGGRIIQDQAET